VQVAGAFGSLVASSTGNDPGGKRPDLIPE
jgi:hypothetical protein